LLPANLRMTTIDISLMPMAGASTSSSGPRQGVGRYEFIVMDAPPAFGLLNLNALMASTICSCRCFGFPVVSRSQIVVQTLGQLEDDLNTAAADPDRH